MAYEFSGSGFAGGQLLGSYAEEEPGADPMSGLANLSDVMLVLACGLMLALVTYFNLDLPSVIEMETSMQEIADVESIEDAVQSQSGGYTKLDNVYQDPNTGKVYLIEQDEGDAGAAPGVTPDEPAADEADQGEGEE